jgi:nitrous oxidase accessory protein
MKSILLFSIIALYSYANILQQAIDSAKPYSTLKLSNGIYKGNLIINKPLTIVGDKNSIILGDGFNSIITIKSDDVELKKLIIKNSGHRLENLDSAISLDKVKNFKLLNSKIIDSLYGINFYMSHNCQIINNYIKSKNLEIELRGNALKMWYSNNNIIKNNTIVSTRDFTLDYSNYNRIENNTFKYNRFATRVEHSKNNIIQNNIYRYNSVAIMLAGAINTDIINNKVLSSNGAAGIGIIIMKGFNTKVLNNQISFNAKGLYIDIKCTEKVMSRYILNNEISYNKEALHFYSCIKNNTIKNNRIYGNIDDAVQDLYAPFDNSNIIEYNYWDRYEGFDKNSDNIGDNPYKIYIYSDWLWHYNNKIKFFHSSPALSLLNFLNQVAPFIEPKLLIIDKKPIFFDIGQ